ncbi:MAG: ABC transporter ATP-binding protein [Verrucomicrobia bacterium]|nr:ABC transporter ATP-binding protein [Verrucomicrobiota bacterium]
MAATNGRVPQLLHTTVTPAIEIKGLTKRYRTGLRREMVLALDHLNLDVQPGEVYGLLGPNGSGKSTTLKLALGLIRATAGEAKIFGKPCTSVVSRLHVGFLPENPYFYRFLTGAETLMFYGRLCGMRSAALTKRVDELLQLVGLTSAASRPLAGYSKGMLQRIGLAQAMVHDPQLLLLDEPTAGVDPIGSKEIRDLIIRLRAMGKTVLLCSHLLTQVQDVCDRICILNQGRKVREGRVDDLLRDQKRLCITVENLPEAARAQIAQWVEDWGASVVSIENPQTTLESLFLDAVKAQQTPTPPTKP